MPDGTADLIIKLNGNPDDVVKCRPDGIIDHSGAPKDVVTAGWTPNSGRCVFIVFFDSLVKTAISSYCHRVYSCDQQLRTVEARLCALYQRPVPAID